MNGWEAVGFCARRRTTPLRIYGEAGGGFCKHEARELREEIELEGKGRCKMNNKADCGACTSQQR